MDNLFRFKQFSVHNEQSAMKVGTDAVLLGAWMGLHQDHRLLDIGTGTGVIALLAAQRMADRQHSSQQNGQPYLIEAIDIDPVAIREAKANFEASPWKQYLQADAVSWQEWSANPIRYDQYDLIFSNPPYFDQAWKPVHQERRLARHSDELPFQALLTGSLTLLKPGGRLALILPVQEGEAMIALAERTLYQTKWRMELCRKTLVYTVTRKPARRMLMEWCKSERLLPLQTDELAIHNPDGSFSDDYRQLTGDFYLDRHFQPARSGQTPENTGSYMG